MILAGHPVAEQIYNKLRKEILISKIKPLLAVILVGDNPANLAYIKIKEKVAENLGLGFKLYHFPSIVPQKEVEKLIIDLNKNKYVSGIVVQLPLPKELDTEKIINLVDIKKDVDGFLGKFNAPTAAAILEILNFYHIEIKNKNIVIVGHGRLVGAPLEKILKKQGIKPIICDSQTINVKDKTLQADILISATGVPNLIKPDMIKQNVVIIDAGTSEAGGKMVGDVSFEVYEKVSAYTPSPGGVGPVTVACLMKNLVEAMRK